MFNIPIPQEKKGVDAAINDMREINHGLHGAADARSKYSENLIILGETLHTLAESQNPDYGEGFAKLEEQFKHISEIEKTLSEEEVRNSEDFRDIIERYFVVSRANKTYMDCKALYQKAGEALESAKNKNTLEMNKATYEKNKFKLEAAIDKAKANKQQALDNLKQSIRDLIEARKKYDAFKIRRLVSGWTRYGNALKTACDAELSAYKEAQNLINDLKNNAPQPAESNANGGNAEGHEAPAQAQNGEEHADPQSDGFE